MLCCTISCASQINAVPHATLHRLHLILPTTELHNPNSSSHCKRCRPIRKTKLPCKCRRLSDGVHKPSVQCRTCCLAASWASLLPSNEHVERQWQAPHGSTVYLKHSVQQQQRQDYVTSMWIRNSSCMLRFCCMMRLVPASILRCISSSPARRTSSSLASNSLRTLWPVFTYCCSASFNCTNTEITLPVSDYHTNLR